MKTLIIAEAGVNHNGDMELAKGLIEAAATAGADMVKFQSFKAEAMVSKTAPKADYQKTNSGPDDSQYRCSKLQLDRDQHLQLMLIAGSAAFSFFRLPRSGKYRIAAQSGCPFV